MFALAVDRAHLLTHGLRESAVVLIKLEPVGAIDQSVFEKPVGYPTDFSEDDVKVRLDCVEAGAGTWLRTEVRAALYGVYLMRTHTPCGSSECCLGGLSMSWVGQAGCYEKHYEKTKGALMRRDVHADFVRMEMSNLHSYHRGGDPEAKVRR